MASRVSTFVPASLNSFASGKEHRSEVIEACLRGVALLQGIERRKLYKVALSINSTQFGTMTRGATPQSAVEDRLQSILKRLRGDRKLRDRLETDMVKAARWPIDSVLLYVPPRKSQAKGIETFAFDGQGVARLNEHPAVAEKVNELGRDYERLWRLLVLVHPSYRDRIIELSEAVDVLVRELWSEFGEAFPEVDLHDSNRVSAIRDAAWVPYICKEHRQAAEQMRRLSSDSSNKLAHWIDWTRFERAPILTTTNESSLGSRDYAERAYLIELMIRELERKTPLSADSAEASSVLRVKERFPEPGDVERYVAPTTVYATRATEYETFRSSYLFESSSINNPEREGDLRRAFELTILARELCSPMITSASGSATAGDGKRKRQPRRRS